MKCECGNIMKSGYKICEICGREMGVLKLIPNMNNNWKRRYSDSYSKRPDNSFSVPTVNNPLGTPLRIVQL